LDNRVVHLGSGSLFVVEQPEIERMSGDALAHRIKLTCRGRDRLLSLYAS
jgi:hypothetical protein